MCYLKALFSASFVPIIVCAVDLGLQEKKTTYFFEVSRVDLGFSVDQIDSFYAELDSNGRCLVISYTPSYDSQNKPFIGNYGLYKNGSKYNLCQHATYRLYHYPSGGNFSDITQIVFDKRNGYGDYFRVLDNYDLSYFRIEDGGEFTGANNSCFSDTSIDYIFQFKDWLFYSSGGVITNTYFNVCVLSGDNHCHIDSDNKVRVPKTHWVNIKPIRYDANNNQVLVGLDSDSRYLLLSYLISSSGSIDSNPSGWISTNNGKPGLQTFLLTQDETVIVAPFHCKDFGKKIASYSLKKSSNKILKELPGGSIPFNMSDQYCVSKMIINASGSRLYTFEVHGNQHAQLVAYRIDSGNLTKLAIMAVSSVEFMRLTPDGCHILIGAVPDNANLVLYKINDPDPDFKCGELPDITSCPAPITPTTPSTSLPPATPTSGAPTTSPIGPTNAVKHQMGEVEKIILMASGGLVGVVIVTVTITMTVYVCFCKHRKGYEPITSFGGEIMPPD